MIGTFEGGLEFRGSLPSSLGRIKNGRRTHLFAHDVKQGWQEEWRVDGGRGFS